MKKLLFLFGLLTSCSPSLPVSSLPTSSTSSPLNKTTVMITNLARNSGGSGTVLFSSPTISEVLTNGHVCEVTRQGGYVTTTSHESSLVVSFVKSKRHDLCIIAVNQDLHAFAALAKQPPVMYTQALVSGHPHLLPNIITNGHFSNKKVIDVMVGSRECNDEDMKSPENAIICSFFGKMPIIKTYETIVVSATIMPGSSGSGIFNSNGELSAVVFAGQGDLGYAFAVPYEFIHNFLFLELQGLKVEFPSAGTSEIEVASNKDFKNIQNICESKESAKNTKLCKNIKTSFTYAIKK